MKKREKRVLLASYILINIFSFSVVLIFKIPMNILGIYITAVVISSISHFLFLEYFFNKKKTKNNIKTATPYVGILFIVYNFIKKKRS